ncbi:hypothetical protein WI36_13720 [Burkholderia ubonensis]|uniref:Uncharacterized protein n=2 Tax=Burkholderia ubonensis TaxID=101571 RepID=A0A102KV28_9BURK|nr:hypothetical protein WI35_26480 [Burkholderia ubonensis]KUZ74517.1 hypothetical protein WI36_13720 [Burkholderia ubonensis]KUZ82049.1 hypothetical protein WI38_32065 [Burkholderia ubonensis]KVA00649.1 hypothetical protein WI39_04995 [Burkholderia ubonensis]KVA22346.1 hypothetical protein WI42_09380 [Burkholderia ubonensis]
MAKAPAWRVWRARHFTSDKLPASHIYATDGERAARKDHSGACCGAVARSHAASGAFDTH